LILFARARCAIARAALLRAMSSSAVFARTRCCRALMPIYVTRYAFATRYAIRPLNHTNHYDAVIVEIQNLYDVPEKRQNGVCKMERQCSEAVAAVRREEKKE